MILNTIVFVCDTCRYTGIIPNTTGSLYIRHKVRKYAIQSSCIISTVWLSCYTGKLSTLYKESVIKTLHKITGFIHKFALQTSLSNAYSHFITNMLKKSN